MTNTQQPSEGYINQPTGQNQTSNIGKDGNIEFERLRKEDLKSIPVLAQALDNQWLPRDLLKEAQKKGKISTDIDRRLRKTVRAEYIRSLINGEQSIMNRAYLYNNPAISQDYSKRNSPEYLAFKMLLEEKAIIVWLLEEESPTDKPIFEVQEKAFDRWIKLCQEIQTPCIRLSWDSKGNKEKTKKQLHLRFQQFVLRAATGDIDTYIQDFGLDQEAKVNLRKILVQMGQLGLDFQSQDKLVTRNILYKEFVTAGNNPSERRYDSSPLAGAIKQLIDLRYNSNLPDVFNGYLITPVDSLPRTALQEWEKKKGQQTTITAKELLVLLQRTSFNLVGSSLNVPSMDMLQLHDVRAIRATEEWALYMQNLQALLKHPEQFADGLAAGVYQSYAALAQHITGQINQSPKKGSLLTSWTPTVELVFNIAGAILSYHFTDQGPQWRLQGKVADDFIEGDTAPVVGRFVIRDLTEEHAQQDLSTGIDFLHFQIPDVQEQWKEIEMEVRKFPGFQEAIAVPEESDSIISYKEPLEA